MKIGHGYDVHKFAENRQLIIGGVNIPHHQGLLGHSDADVLLHAIADSLLGAAMMEDIGAQFPDNDEKFLGADSIKLLSKVVELISKESYIIINIDSTILAQEPKMKPHILQMRKNIAKACSINLDQINVKATTEEGLGFTGEKQGIAAHSVCLIEKTS